jgi:hypothetical protein
MKYILTSTQFKGQIIMIFNSKNRLVYFEIKAQLTDEQQEYFVKHAPAVVSGLDVFRRSTTVKIDEVKLNLSFETFWDAYSYKEGVKADAYNTWTRMSQSSRIAALEFIPIYDGKLAVSGLGKAYPTKYLSKKYWETE